MADSTSMELEGLSGLGVSMRSQETLETEVMDQLEERMKEQERVTTVKQVKKEFPPLKQKLILCLKKKKSIERDIRDIHSKGGQNGHQKRKIVSLIDDQEAVQKHLLELFATQKDLLQRLTSCGYDFHNDPDIQPIKSNHNETEEQTNEETPGETDLQRSIRLGEVTAFGTSLQTTSQVGSSSRFDDYVKYQIQHQQRDLKRKRDDGDDDSDSGFIEVGPSPSQKRTTKLTKKVKKEIISTPQEDSDWCPSEVEEEKELIIKKPKKKTGKGKMRPVDSDEDIGGWKTDDSDFEGTDDEAEKKTNKKKSTDDGDKERYMARLANWQSSRTEEEKTLDGKYEEMEGGLKAPSSIWDKLFDYQKVGVQWMFELHQQNCGGILGDEMGLGKTIQVAAFLASLSYSQVIWRGSRWRGLGPCIIVCPTTVLHQWVRELQKWWPPLRVAVLHSSGSHTGSTLSLARSINSSCGILVLSYQAVATHIEMLSGMDWHYLILDEGHMIRNPDAKVTLAVKQVATAHRLILSGSPMQNNLKELWSLFDFIYPGKLGTLPVFLKEFSSPITAGGYANASTVQVATAFRCATVLRDTISPYLLRRMKADVKQHINLPEKNEQVLFCRLTEEQRALYRAYIDGGETKLILSGNMKVFVGLIALRMICNHPDLHSGGPKTIPNADPAEERPEDEFGWYKRSGKMVVIHSLLKLWKKQGHRVLLFSQSRQMIKILEKYVKGQGYSYLKLDGTTAVSSRQGLIEKFNTSDIFVFLLTTRVGGLGVNLTGANRVVIFDPDWNPSTDMQARERSWRIGQKKQVTIYRLMTAGTIEEKIYHRQIYKQFLVNRVLKDPKQRRFFKSNDLYELFTLTETTEDGDTETSAIFAGTGSNIKVAPKSGMTTKDKEKYDLKVFKPEKRKRKEADGAKTNIKKSLKRLYKEDKETKNINERKREDEQTSSNLSEDLREKLREQARRINAKFKESKQRVEQKLNQVTLNVEEDAREEGELTREEEPAEEIDLTLEKVKPPMSVNIKLENIKPVNSEKDKKSHKSHKHKIHKSKKSKHKKLEGERVEGLVKARKFKPPVQDTEEQQRVAECQDDYVLTKLFSKSGVIGGIQHDSIMEDGTADYAIVESEANEKAKKAVAAMKASRQECMRAEAGVPNWTGHNGGAKKPKFGAKKKGKAGASMSSAELLALMKGRNSLVSTVPADTPEESDLFRPDHRPSGSAPRREAADTASMDLLADIRNFVAFQARADGEASTGELVGRFKTSLPSQQSPLFKAFLQQICDFSRDQEGRGMWTLKAEFR